MFRDKKLKPVIIILFRKYYVVNMTTCCFYVTKIYKSLRRQGKKITLFLSTTFTWSFLEYLKFEYKIFGFGLTQIYGLVVFFGGKLKFFFIRNILECRVMASSQSKVMILYLMTICV